MQIFVHIRRHAVKLKQILTHEPIIQTFPLDNLLSTSINGDEFDAKNLEEMEKFTNKDDMDDNMQDSDNDDNDGENVS